MKQPKNIYIGLMSGTSLDGIDAVAVEFEPEFKLLATHSEAIPSQLKNNIQQLMLPGNNEIDLMGKADIQLGLTLSKAVNTLIEKNKLDKNRVVAVGSHGQTIRHRPEFSFTLQIGDGNLIAEKTGITTVADFRRRDMAADGEGAPLAPAFHNAMLRSTSVDRVVLNIGGMANITYLAADQQISVTGFDTGPGNVLMNAWINKKLDQEYDKDGDWAASGNVNHSLLDVLLDLEYFKQAPPKSTGREQFNLDWLESTLSGFTHIPENDVQATLAEFTVVSIKNHLTDFIPSQNYELYTCGGGSHNRHLMDRLNQEIPAIKVCTTDEIGIDADWMEAAAFAWLAKQCLEQKFGNLSSVTGANGNRILGAIYQA